MKKSRITSMMPKMEEPTEEYSERVESDESPYTVVVQIPQYVEQGISEEPIYVYGGSENDQERIGEFYENVEEVGYNNLPVNEPEDTEQQYVGHDDDQESSLLPSGTPVRIVPNPSGKSAVWNHFGFVPLGDTDEPDRRRAVCRICYIEVPFSGNTTNLQFHLHRYHRGSLPSDTEEAGKKWRTFSSVRRKKPPLRRLACKTEDQKPKKRVVNEAPATPGIYWHTVQVNQLHVQIAKALVTDCLPISYLDGPGLQSLVKMLDSNFDSKSVEMIRAKVLPQLHLEAKQEIGIAIGGSSSLALSLEAWQNKEANLSYIGVTCHYLDGMGNVYSKYLRTIEVSPKEEARSISERISQVFSELSVNMKGTLTGCTVTEQSEGLYGTVNNAIDILQLPRFPCLSSAFQQASNRLLQVTAVCQAMKKVNEILNFVNKISSLRNKYYSRITVCNALIGQNIPFVSLFQALKMVVELEQLFGDVEGELRSLKSDLVPLDAKDFATLSVVLTILQPFMDAAETINGESFPSISIVLPVLYKVTNIALYEGEDDSLLSSDLKHSTKSYLKSVYSRDQNQLYLRTAMYLDPRLKTLPFFTEEEKRHVQGLLKTELTKLIKKSGVIGMSSPRGSAANKKPRLSSLLGDMFPEAPDPTPKDPSGNFAENIARSEITCYANEDPVSLDDSQPLKWWKAREGQYKFLSKMARKLLCIPCTSIPTRRFLTPEGLKWAERRAMLPPEEVPDIVFLGEFFSQ